MNYNKHFSVILCTLISLFVSSSVILPIYAVDTTGTEEEPPVGTWYILEDGTKVIQIDTMDGGIADVLAIYEYDGSKDIGIIDTKTTTFDLISISTVLAYCGYDYSQSQLANMLGNTSAGSTIPNMMNNITSGSTYKFYWVWQIDSRYTELFKQHCLSDLVNSESKKLIVVNTIEEAGIPILKGHEGYGNIAHFGVVNGIYQSCDIVKYTDPVFGYFSGFVKEQNVTIVDMCRALGGRGYVW